jgi:hypothetical protein
VHVRSGRWILLTSLALALPVQACSGGYPLPPTRCDEWCDATKGGSCQDYYGPASCVAECESGNVDVAACSAPFDAVITCFRHSPRALEQRCSYDNVPDDCDAEAQTLAQCVASQSTISRPNR